MDCFRWAKKETGTAPFPKAKEYQKVKIGAYDQESEVDLYTTDNDSEDFSDSGDREISEDEQEDQVRFEEEQEEGDDSSEEKQEEGNEEVERNWWDSHSEPEELSGSNIKLYRSKLMFYTPTMLEDLVFFVLFFL